MTDHPPRGEREPRVLLCVDMSYQVYRAAAAHPNLSCRRSGKHIFTGGLYGFLVTWAKTMRETRATHVAFGLDVKPYVRSLAYPQYKDLRKKAMDEDLKQKFAESFPMVLGALESAGLTAWGVPGFEFDDLVAHAVRKYRHRFDTIYAASNDSDIFQLFSYTDRFRVYRKDLATCMHRALLLKETGLTPEQYMLVTALMGSHNDVEGIPRVGEVTAIKAVKNPALLRSYYAQHGALIERNLSLIRLPHAQFPQGERIPGPGPYNPRQMYRYLSVYDIDVTGAIERAFEQVIRRKS